MKNGIRRAAVLLALVTLLSAPAWGFNNSGKRWTLNRTVVMHLSLGGPIALQDGFHSFNESAADVLRMWNTYLVHMQFAPRIASLLPPADSDENSSAFFSSTVYGEKFGKDVLAVTLTSSRASILTEADTVFNTAWDWDSYRGALQSGTEDFHRVALHEFGHSLGLDHPDDIGQKVAAIMNSRESNTETLQPDDISGVQTIYGSGPAYRTIPGSANLVNLSTRGFVGTNDQVLIGGFILDGSQATSVILRALGGSLKAFSIPNPLGDPVIELRDGNGALLASNDDWIDSADAETIASYHLDPSNSIESAIYRTLNPGNYTALVHSFDNGDGMLTGTGLVELYDLHSTAGGRARNISTRGEVLTNDDVVIAGFIIGGTQPKEVVIRGLGSSLLDSNVGGVLLDPKIDLYNSAGQLIASNDNWESDPGAERVRALNLAPKRTPEAALARVLNAGSYTVIMRGVNDTTGIGLIEVYDTSAAP